MRASPVIASFIGASVVAVCATLLAYDPKAMLPTAEPAPALTPLQAEVTADLKALHAALVKYLIAHKGVWPQQPDDLIDGDDERKFLKWWTDQLRPFGAKDTDWYVSEQGEGNKEHWDGDRPLISYIPTSYEAAPLTAYRWRSQPWLITRFQAPGGIILFPEGTVKIMPFAEEMMKLAVKDESGLMVIPQKEDEKGPVPISKIPEPLRHLATGEDWKPSSKSSRK
jgi:hypothetical protein